MQESRSKRIYAYPLLTFVAIIIAIFLFYALFSGLSIKFYASFLFLFYSWIGHIWIAVICVGVFQTIILIPLRIINLKLSTNTKNFEEKLAKLKSRGEQYFIFKKSFFKGDPAVLFFTIEFLIHAVSFLSLGKLFLTDFYNQPLNPKLLFPFAPYPTYPILHTYFLIPYAWFKNTLDLGPAKMWFVWKIIFFVMIATNLIRSIYLKLRRDALFKQPIVTDKDKQLVFAKRIFQFINGSYALFFFFSWLLIRHFPTNWTFRLFTGTVVSQNTTFNFITAVGTFITIMWLDMPKILKQVQLAREKKIPESIIRQTQKELFVNTLRNAVILALGAFYITNHIPCAFELSVFTLEVISWISPLTIDRLVYLTDKKMRYNKEEKKAETKS